MNCEESNVLDITELVERLIDDAAAREDTEELKELSYQLDDLANEVSGTVTAIELVWGMELTS